MSEVRRWIDYGTSGTMPPIEVVAASDYDALRDEVERLKADIRDARGLMRGMIDAKDGRVARFLIERAERFIQRTADPTDASPASTTDA